MTSTVPPPRVHRTDPLLGAMVNAKYRVVELIAAGGMGKVYRGEQLPLGRAVAIKVLHAGSTAHLDDPMFQRRFFREASILSRLQHPNIVTVFDYGRIEGDDERYYMVMEFLSGLTLYRRICERVMLAPGEVIRIARQIASGLGEAHANGIVHRDLKPSNVMLVSGRDGAETVKLLDFGIVKVVGEDDPHEDLTQEGSFVGSPRYMAPEQIVRGGNIDARTDVYSLGVILYQCLCGAVPFDAESPIQTMMAHVSQEPPPLHARAPGANVPEFLDELVMTCLAKEPSRRPASMASVARRLAEGEALYPPASGERPPGGRAIVTIATPQSSRAPMADTPAAPATNGAPRPSQNDVDTVDAEAIQSVPPRDDIDRTRASAVLPSRRAPVSPLPFAVGAVAMLAAVLVAIAVRREGTEAPRAAAPMAPKRSFSLVVESDPAGADVLEGTTPLGTTPIHLTIDNGSATPRKLSVRLRGYQPYSIVQGASEDDIRIFARLVRDPLAQSGEPSALQPPNAEPKVVTPATPSARPGDARKPLDIRRTR